MNYRAFSQNQRIQEQQARLQIERQNLAMALEQLALNGGVVHAPLPLIQTITSIRANIAQIKTTLLNWGVVVEDLPDDLEPQRPIAVAPPVDKNRTSMIRLVRWKWIEGVLKRSLWNEARIVLHLAAGAVRPYGISMQSAHNRPQLLPADSRIIDLYDHCPAILLILGDPGSGKTTLLLELAEDLLKRAERDPSLPIPVIFSLSAWGGDRPPMHRWFVQQLHQDYGVPEGIAQMWVSQGRIQPLLDGLDEVEEGRRVICVAAINAYRSEHPASWTIPLVVCCRNREYMELPVLRQCSAITVQPLSTKQIDDYIEAGGSALAGVRHVLSQDQTLYSLLETPLFLSMITMAFAEKPATILQEMISLPERRAVVFESFIQRMFSPEPPGKGEDRIFSRQEILTGLHWLSVQLRMQQTSLTYYLETMQPDWIQNPIAEAFIRWNTVIISALIGYAVGRWLFIAEWSPALGVCMGAFTGVLISLENQTRFTLGHMLSWEINEITMSSAIAGGMAGVFVGSVLGGIFLLTPFHLLNSLTMGELAELMTWVESIGIGLLTGMLAGGLIGGAIGGIVGVVPDNRIKPNEGVVRSLRNIVLVGVLIALLCILCLGTALDLMFGVVSGLVIGGLAALIYGGHAIIQHYTLRFLLWLSGAMPWNIAGLLDAAARRSFLRRVGGGWIFTHRLLLEYIAELRYVDIKRILHG